MGESVKVPDWCFDSLRAEEAVDAACVLQGFKELSGDDQRWLLAMIVSMACEIRNDRLYLRSFGANTETAHG